MIKLTVYWDGTPEPEFERDLESFLSTWGFARISSGCGMGERDIQFARQETDQETETLPEDTHPA